MRIDGTNVTDDGLVALKRLAKLETLALGGSLARNGAVTTRGLLQIQGSPIQSISLGRIGPDDFVLEALKSMPNLTSVTFHRATITATQAERLAEFGGAQDAGFA